MTTVSAPVATYVDTVESNLHDGPASLREAGFEVRRCIAGDDDELARAAVGATALLVGDTPIRGAALNRLPDLRIIAAATAGTDHIDLDAARRRGLWVTNVPDATTEEVATHALAMILALVRHLPFWDRHVRSGGWDWRATGHLSRPSTMTLGIVGLGRIGRKLAGYAGPLFGSVLGHDPAHGDWPEGVERTELDELLERAHVVSLHVPLAPDSHRLLDRTRLARMRPGAYLVNVSRGRLIDAQALLEALDAGRLAGAGLDVLYDEPPQAGDPLVRHSRVLLTPHVAFLSAEGERDSAACQAANVVSWLRDGRPLAPVVEGPP